MLHEEIKSAGVMRMVACQLCDDLRQELDIYDSYTVEKDVMERQTNVYIYSDEHCNILTSSCVDTLKKVVQVYRMMYDGTTYCVTTITKGEGEDRRIIPAIEITISLSE